MTADPYQAALLAKARQAADDRPLADPTASATIDNPLCADRVTIDAKIADGRIVGVGWRVRACALCQAATVLMAEAVTDADCAAAADGQAAVRAMLEGGEDPREPYSAFAMFRSVAPYRSRHDCVLLPFEALVTALRDPPQ